MCSIPHRENWVYKFGPLYRAGGYKEMSSIFADQYKAIQPSYMSPNAAEGGGGVARSPNEYSCAHHVALSPNKLWRSASIFDAGLMCP
jgi:hypothetical protein